MEKLVIKNVSKKLGGRQILSDINLTLETSRIYGFVGKNGSGKTMLFRAISGLMKVTEGEISLDGKVLHKDFSVLPSLGIIIENVGLYPEFSAMENLKLLARIKRIIGETEIRAAIERVGLDPDDKRPIRKYSLGMKQRLVLAQALMEKPEILILDEPTNALDEGGVDLLRRIIFEEKERGALIMLASHSREDIELLCDEIYVIKNGRIEKKEVTE